MDKIIGKIYQTTNYDSFKRLKGNRDVRNAKKIVDSINKVGYVLSPILVNENMEVIDGQNRLDALRQLDLPVPYIMQEGIGRTECQALNINQSNWTTEQFINSYAECGEESYERLQFLVSTFKKKGFGLEGVVFMAVPGMIPRAGGATYAGIKEGTFELSEDRYELTKTRLISAIDLGFAIFKEKYEMNGRSFWGAIAYAYEHQEVDIKQLAYKIIANPHEIISVSRVADQLRYFDDIYNKGKKPQARVFMSTDFLKRKNL
jgi:hypothetical protein